MVFEAGIHRGMASALALASVAVTATPVKLGVPAVQRTIGELIPGAEPKLGNTADWVAISHDGAWIGATGPNRVHHINARSNKIDMVVALPGEPCAGLAVGFDSLWVPICGTAPSTVRIDTKSGRLIAVLPFGPPSEGGIAVSQDSVWMATDATGTIARVDPKTNKIRQIVRVAAGSFNPIASGEMVWITSVEKNLVTAIDARTGALLGKIRTGPSPRFLTAGAGSVWTLNQGDGTVTRIDVRTMRARATIPLGIPGHGGDIHFGHGLIWATSFGFPLTAVDPRNNRVIRQWVGKGGDSLRVGHESIWLTDYRAGTYARIPLRATHLPR
jgi:virginiamycin B lyase